MQFRKNKLVKILFLTTSLVIFVSCGGWSSKEKSEFVHECKGETSDEAVIDECKCLYKVVSKEFTYQEVVDIGLKDFSVFKNQSQPEDSKLKRITPSISECYKSKEVK